MKLRDRTNGRMIETAGEYYPFIILEGFVTEVKLEEIRTIREVSFSMEAVSWILGDGIELVDTIIRKSGTCNNFYAISKTSLQPGQNLKFAIRNMDPNASGTLTIGFTIAISNLNVNELPAPGSLSLTNWINCPNVLSCATVGQEFIIKFNDTGIQLKSNGHFLPLVRKQLVRPNTHFFFYFSGKVTEIRFVPRTPKRPPKAEAAAVQVPPAPQVLNGYCLLCYDNESTYMMVPCGHLCLCNDCLSVFDQPSCLFCRAIIEKKVKAFFPGRTN